MRALLALAAFAATGCTGGADAPTGANPGPGTGPVRLALSAGVVANAGALVEAEVSYTPPGGARTLLASDSLTVNTGGPESSLSLAADVSNCVRGAASRGGTCTLDVVVRLRRDGRLLDEFTRQVTVDGSTSRVDVPAVQLFEVATIRLEQASMLDFEPGDSRTFTATPVDRGGEPVTGRAPVWERVSGGITVSAQGEVRAVTPGPARLRVTAGGREVEFALDVRPSSVASITLAPLDTTISVGGSFAYRATVRSATGEVLTGRSISFTSSNGIAVPVTAVGGFATGVAIGTSTIIARSSEGRGGTTITSAPATLRVEAPPAFQLDPATLTFETELDQPLPEAQTVAVRNAGGGSLGTVSLAGPVDGLTTSLDRATVPLTLTVRPSAALAPGETLIRTVRLRSSTAGVAEGTVTVTLTGRQPSPVIIDRSAVVFDSIAPGDANTISVDVTTSTGRQLSGLQAQVTYDQPVTPWLSATLDRASTPATLALRASAGALPVGDYTASVRLTSSDRHQPATLRVTMRVRGGIAVVLSPSALLFDGLRPGASESRDINVTSRGPMLTGLTTRVSYDAGQPTGWLAATLTAGSTPTTLRLTVQAGSLSNVERRAWVVVSAATPGSIPDSVRVTVRVLDDLRVVLDPDLVLVGPLDPSQSTGPVSTITVRSSSGATLAGLTTRTEYLSGVENWLTASLAATQAAPSTTLQLTPRPSGLPEGTFQARVIVSSSTAGAAPDTVRVELTVRRAVTLPGRFSGLVVNATTAQPIAEASVVIRQGTAVMSQVSTGSDGRWTSGVLFSGSYNISVAAPGFQSAALSGQQLVGGANTPVTPLQTVQLVPVGTGVGRIIGLVRDATTNALIPSATVELRTGANNTAGAAIATTQTNANGSYTFGALAPGAYTVRVIRTGYSTVSFTITVSGSDVTPPVAFLSPLGASTAWRFVLSWGSVPQDLDSHLTGPVPESSTRFHVYFNAQGSATSSPFALLDQDVTEGTGPETITIHQQFPGTYRYYVHNFSGEGPISTAGARVDVYQGNTFVGQFFPPQQSGTYWTVFEINGSTLTQINTIGTAQPSIVASDAVGPRNGTPATRAAAEWLELAPWRWTKVGRPARR